jgi:hypothetical protein
LVALRTNALGIDNSYYQTLRVAVLDDMSNDVTCVSSFPMKTC